MLEFRGQSFSAYSNDKLEPGLGLKFSIIIYK